MTEYLIYEFVDHNKKVFTLTEKELFKLLDEIRESQLDGKEPRKIVVYTIGECLIDWS